MSFRLHRCCVAKPVLGDEVAKAREQRPEEDGKEYGLDEERRLEDEGVHHPSPTTSTDAQMSSASSVFWNA